MNKFKKRSVIDTKRFEEYFPLKFRKDSVKVLKDTPPINPKSWWKTTSNFLKIPPLEDVKSLGEIDDLLQPNLYMLDFILSLKDKEKHLILDWGCGMGMMLHYLNHIGIKTLGYDKFKKTIPRHRAVDFLTRLSPLFHSPINLKDFLLSPTQVLECNPTIIGVMGVQHTTGFVIPKSVEYLIIDVPCSLHPQTIKEFSIKKYWESKNVNPKLKQLLQRWNRWEDKIKIPYKNFELVKNYTSVAVFKKNKEDGIKF